MSVYQECYHLFEKKNTELNVGKSFCGTDSIHIINRIVIGDETGVHFYGPEPKQESIQGMAQHQRNTKSFIQLG